MDIKHEISFKDIELKIGGYWSEYYDIQKWTDKELLEYFWEIAEVEGRYGTNPQPHRNLVNLLIEIDRRGLVVEGS